MSKSLLQEATLKTLSVMTHVDTNINPVEVQTVQRIMKDQLGMDVTSNEVYKAAKSEYIENKDVDKYLKSVRKDLSHDDRMVIMSALKEVVTVDGNTHDYEVALFNKVAVALEMDPAKLMEL